MLLVIPNVVRVFVPGSCFYAVYLNNDTGKIFHIYTVCMCSKAVLLLWIFYVFVLSCVCYVFVRVCLYVLCGHLLGKG